MFEMHIHEEDVKIEKTYFLTWYHCAYLHSSLLPFLQMLSYYRRRMCRLAWSLTLWWMLVVRRKMRIHQKQTEFLQNPDASRLKEVPKVCLNPISVMPKSDRYNGLLQWIALTANIRPDLTRKLISVSAHFAAGYGQWYMDVVDVLAATGRVRIITEEIRHVRFNASPEQKKVKLLEWVQNPLFAKACIVKELIRMLTDCIHDLPTERAKLTKAIFTSVVVKETATQVAEWLARKLISVNDKMLRNYCDYRRKTNKYPELSAALRATQTAKKMFQRDKLRATVRLALFFRGLQKPTRIVHDTCFVCWNKRFLQPLHDDVRHAVCRRCCNKLIKNGIHACPMCRTYINIAHN